MHLGGRLCGVAGWHDPATKKRKGVESSVGGVQFSNAAIIDRICRDDTEVVSQQRDRSDYHYVEYGYARE